MSLIARLKNIRPNRGIGSYSLVQSAVCPLLRGRRFQLRSRRIQGLRYLDLGAGPNTHEEFINVDFQWRPGIDLCWDISRGLPFASGSLDGIFTEHCIEHLSMPTAMRLLADCRRMLARTGRMRIVVPDAELYLRGYADGAFAFPYGQTSPEGISSQIVAINQVFYQDRDSPFGHVWMYDFHLLEQVLRAAGFQTVERMRFGVGADAKLLIDTPSRASESLYVEAS
jgi:predicted SAM-dependent methyltransferase